MDDIQYCRDTLARLDKQVERAQEILKALIEYRERAYILLSTPKIVIESTPALKQEIEILQRKK